VIVAIEKSQRALLLSGDDGWALRVRTGDDLVLGRGEDTALPIPSIATDRRHARIRFAGDRCTVEDLGSTSGTYLNGALVRSAQPISEGDELRIGPFRVAVALAR
jgi:pSer/pThr/pTyr-binding forkhead associated (FHA) protein